MGMPMKGSRIGLTPVPAPTEMLSVIRAKAVIGARRRRAMASPAPRAGRKITKVGDWTKTGRGPFDGWNSNAVCARATTTRAAMSRSMSCSCQGEMRWRKGGLGGCCVLSPPFTPFSLPIGPCFVIALTGVLRLRRRM